MTIGMRRLPAALALALAATAIVGAPARAAVAPAPWWQPGVEVAPTYLPPGGTGEVIVTASNLGDEAVNAADSPVTLTDTLPAGLVPISVEGAAATEGAAEKTTRVKCPAGEPPPPTVTCTFTGTLNPYQELSFTIKVKVEAPAGTVAARPDQVTVEGGGAGRASKVVQLQINGQPTPFGVQDYELQPTNEDGTPATQAGQHPFQLTTTLVLNQLSQDGGLPHPVALPKDFSFNLPAGLLGSANLKGTESEPSQCSEADFVAYIFEANLCPPSSVVGVATVTAWEPVLQLVTKTVPVFNLVPTRGEPARFGFEIIGSVPIVIDTAVRSGRDYGVVASVRNTTQTAGLLSSQVTLWGDPGDPRHDDSRGWECVAGGYFKGQIKRECPSAAALPQEAFLTMPTSCPADPAAEPLSSTAQADSWADPEAQLGTEYAWISESGEALFNRELHRAAVRSGARGLA